MHTFRFRFLCAIVVLATSVNATEIKTIYVVPFTHNDVGFDGTPTQMAAYSVQSIDEAIAQAAIDPEYVWSIETFWQLRHWLDAGRDSGPLLALLRDGRFGLNAAYICPHTSVMKPWILDQNFRIPVHWGQENGLALDWAMLNDVPGHPPGLPKFLDDNGVKYLAVGANQVYSKKLPEEISNTPFWWESLDGKHRVLTFICAEAYTGAFKKYGKDLPVRRGGFGGAWDQIRYAIPTATRAAYAQEKVLMAQPSPNVHAIGRLLAFYGHTIGHGPGFANHLTRETIVEHNRQFVDLLQADWPREKIVWPEGEPVQLPRDAPGEQFGRNQLYLVRYENGTITREPMPDGSWLMHRAERLDDGALRLRHRIDRTKLPPGKVTVVWAWHLTDREAKAPVTVHGATDPWVWIEDGLAGYYLNGWIAPEEFKIGTTAFRPHGPIWFKRVLGRPEILCSTVLRQIRTGQFKDAGEDTLTYDEACPGEDPIYECAIDIIAGPSQ